MVPGALPLLLSKLVYEIVFFALKSYAGHPGSYSFNALMGSLQFFLRTQH